MDKCQENYPSAFRTAPKCTVTSTQIVSDATQTNAFPEPFGPLSQGRTGDITHKQHQIPFAAFSLLL